MKNPDNQISTVKGLAWGLAAILGLLTGGWNQPAQAARAGESNAAGTSIETTTGKQPKPAPEQFDLHLGVENWRLQLRAYPTGEAAATNRAFKVDVAMQPDFQAGKAVRVRSGQKASSALAILGDATVEAEVNGDVLVLLGDAKLASNAVVKGSVVVVGGTAEVAPGTKVDGDFLVLGGKLKDLNLATRDGKTAGTAFKPGGKLEVVELFPQFKKKWSWAENWVRQGLLWGRPLTLGAGWVWLVAATLALLMVFVQLLLPKAVQRCAVGFHERPGLSLALGVLLALLFPILILVLVATGIGVIAAPFVLLLLLLVLLIGNTGVHLAVGEQCFKQFGGKTVNFPVLALLTGLALVGLLYLVPVLGGIVLVLVLTGALGASITGLIQMRNQESPPPCLPSLPVYNAAPVAPAPPAITAAPADTVPPLWNTATPTASSAMPPLLGTADFASSSMLLARGIVPSQSRPRPAGFWRRLGCALIDYVLILFLVNLATALLSHGKHTDMRLVVFTLMAYHLFFWWWRGTTVGGVIGKLKVIGGQDGALTFKEAIVRVLAALLSSLCLGLGFLAIAWSRDKRAWHDLLAGTRVEQVPTGVSLMEKPLANQNHNDNNQTLT